MIITICRIKVVMWHNYAVCVRIRGWVCLFSRSLFLTVKEITRVREEDNGHVLLVSIYQWEISTDVKERLVAVCGSSRLEHYRFLRVLIWTPKESSKYLGPIVYETLLSRDTVIEEEEEYNEEYYQPLLLRKQKQITLHFVRIDSYEVIPRYVGTGILLQDS